MHDINYSDLITDAVESVYMVTDADTHELLYMNKTALRTYGIPEEEQAYRGKRCYELIRGESEPCKDCPINRIHTGEKYRWEQFIDRIGKWYDHKDYLVERDGRRFYINMATDITAGKEGRFRSAERITTEDALFRCMNVLITEKDFNISLRLFLETVACYYQADRAYLYEVKPEKNALSHTCEWCREGVSAGIENLYKISPDLVQKWLRKFGSIEAFSISVSDPALDRDSDKYRLLAAKGIESLMMTPLQMEDHAIAGFIGVDNPRRQLGNLQLLRTTAEFILAELEKHHLFTELEHLSNTDMLTGAYNRNRYEHYIKRCAIDSPQSLGAIMANINGMKEVNRLYGTSHGDAVITRTCNIISDTVPGQLFRISGDEFAVLCENIPQDRFQAIVSDLRRRLQTQNDCPVSVGCAWQGDEPEPEKLIEQAKELMYAEKRNYYSSVLKGSGRPVYTGADGEVLREIHAGRFIIYFQPQVDFSKGGIFGAEVLVRKIGEDGALIPPDRFIPYYESAGVIRYVDLHVLELACAAIREWEKEGMDLHISVNFSRLTLMEPGIVDTIVEVCRRYGIDPERITVEVTENINKMDEMHLSRLIRQLKENHFRISLDDFGSSYSNLAVLSTIEFDEVKFDRSLIKHIETNQKSQVVVRNSLKMCGELEGSMSVAEGIETEGQMELLIQYGCDIGQGYYFSKPVSQDEFSAMLKEKKIYSHAHAQSVGASAGQAG